MLAVALREHRGALSASLLAVYGIRIGDVPLSELADLTAYLPAGCAFWQSFGGPLAWSEDQHLLARIEFLLRAIQFGLAGGKGTKPKPMEPPKFAAEQKAQEAADRLKADRWLARDREKE